MSRVSPTSKEWPDARRALYGVSVGNGAKTIAPGPRDRLATAIGSLYLAGGDTAGLLDLGMTATCDGKLWLASGTRKFWKVDPHTGVST